MALLTVSNCHDMASPRLNYANKVKHYKFHDYFRYKDIKSKNEFWYLGFQQLLEINTKNVLFSMSV